MQPTLRQTPPSVGSRVDEHDVPAEVGGSEGGGVAARAGAEHENFAVEIGFRLVGSGDLGGAAVAAAWSRLRNLETAARRWDGFGSGTRRLALCSPRP